MPRRLTFRFFLGSLTLLVFAYGFAVGKYQVFPYRFLALANDGFGELRERAEPPWYYRHVSHSAPAIITTNASADGLNLVTRMAADRKLSAEIIDMQGRTVQHWDLDWFKLWPDPSHVPPDYRPRSRPGAQVHGAVVMDNGDLVFNFDHLGLVRLNRQGEVVWRLNYRTHHSVHRHDDGNLWVCGQRERDTFDSRFPHRRPPYDEYTILEVSPDGRVVHEWSVPRLLLDNNKIGLLHLGSDQPHAQVRHDLLHLNDVEPFPDSMPEGIFKRGDVLVSLRNINTVFVFNRHTGRITYCCAGAFVGQHDPDFIDGNHFSVFDNNTISRWDAGLKSRILVVSAANESIRVVSGENSPTPFFTRLMGKHQWLPNGNLLVTSSMEGRAFEINQAGELLWQYTNYVAPHVVGNVQQVQRLPAHLEGLFPRETGSVTKGATGLPRVSGPELRTVAEFSRIWVLLVGKSAKFWRIRLPFEEDRLHPITQRFDHH